MSNFDTIDFVVPWVDDSDLVWQEKKTKYTGVEEKEGNTDVRYRDWDTLKYWFRGVEKYAPWVRHVYFVTDNQKPEWLNVDHPKLKWIHHTDFIPSEYLPTFSCQAIEWNLHRIEGLSDNFVYFNDDIFLIKDTRPEDFFVEGMPCDFPRVGMIYPSNFFSHMLFNNVKLLNRHFSLKNSIKKNICKWIKKQSLYNLIRLGMLGRTDLIPACTNSHIHISYKKESFVALWEQEQKLIHETCQNKLRTKNDVTSWCVRDWQLLSGTFYPKRPIGRQFPTSSMSHSNEAIEYLRKQKGKVICLNDSEDEIDFELHKKMIIEEFEKLFPDKSSFEK